METIEAIKTRRSIREFLRRDVDNKIIRKIIEAGTRAPSSKNKQNWHFIILKGEKKNNVADIVEKEFRKGKRKIFRKGKKEKPTTLSSCEIVRNAPVLILAFNKAPYTHGEKNVINECSYEAMLAWTVEVEGVSAAIQNMLLAVHSLGLGGVWLADFNFARKKICKYLGCKYDLLSGIAFGYPAYKLPARRAPETDFKIIE